MVIPNANHGAMGMTSTDQVLNEIPKHARAQLPRWHWYAKGSTLMYLYASGDAK